MNIQIEYSQKILLLENFMRRMRQRKQGDFLLDGIITQAERNALHTAIQSLKLRTDSLKIGNSANELKKRLKNGDKGIEGYQDLRPENERR